MHLLSIFLDDDYVRDRIRRLLLTPRKLKLLQIIRKVGLFNFIIIIISSSKSYLLLLLLLLLYYLFFFIIILFFVVVCLLLC